MACDTYLFVFCCQRPMSLGRLRWGCQVDSLVSSPSYGAKAWGCSAPITRTWSSIRVACRDIASSEIQADSLHVSNLARNS